MLKADMFLVDKSPQKMKEKGVSISDVLSLFKLSPKEYKCWLVDGIFENAII